MTQVSLLPMSVALPLAVLAGTVIPIQGRINGALGARLGDGVSAAVVSFSTGLAVMVVVSLLHPRGRAGIGRLVAALREHSLSPVYLTPGFMGAGFVFVQSSTVALLGIAVFTIAAVAGQSLSGILVDRWGIGPAGKKHATVARVLGALLTLVAVLWAVSPYIAPAGAGTQLWLLTVLLPVAAGALMSVQQAMNGAATAHYGTVITTTLIHFVAGTLILLLAWLIKAAISGAGRPLPEQWWYYLGGLAGCLYIGLGSLVVHRLGVLVTGLAMVSGQLFGSLGLDLLLPTPGTSVTMPTVYGTVLALFAVVLASVPWSNSALSRPVEPAEEKVSRAADRSPGS